MENNTVYKKWKKGELTLLGSFQTTIFQAFQIAGGENQQRLISAFPHWFLNAEQNNNNPKSSVVSFELGRLTNDLIETIKIFLDQKLALKLDPYVKLCYSNDDMYMILKRDGRYILQTTESCEYSIDDQGNVSIDDLLCIQEQIEKSQNHY